ncbi:MerR family transcriptional regulator [Amycolatopsis samaneae]|uniref:MerR family transcriptional regulator n=1 Tax=Amycolatopsis samaneae TaxID=664691 RepID=A0ABW5GAQ5_9PSEU
MSGPGGADQRRWSVGALAKATGTTVRALHHYDELGLLRPSERTRSGHRRYTERDLHLLYRIRLLRQLGMSLEEIGGVLADPGVLREVLDRRLEEIDDEVWRLTALGRQIRGLLEQLNDARPRPDTGELLTLLGRTSLFDSYITREQRDLLDERAGELGDDGRKWLDAEWPQVLTKLAEHCRAGDPVDAPEVVRTLRRLFVVLDMYTGGDAGLKDSVARFFRERGLGVLRDVAPEGTDVALGDELWDYVAKAYAAALSAG